MSTYTFDDLMKKIDKPGTLNGELKKIAKEIKKDHELAIRLWETERYFPRLLSVLLLDRKELTLKKIEKMSEELLMNEQKERNHIGDWLLANQLIKTKSLKVMLEGFENHPSPFFRRLFWYYQARLRWTGQTSHENTSKLVDSIAIKLEIEDTEVQMAINFCAGWIGVYDEDYSNRIIQIGKDIGLYKDVKVPRGCAPMYLPEFIQYEKDLISKTPSKS